MCGFFKELYEEMGVEEPFLFWTLLILIILLTGGIVICLNDLGIGETEYIEGKMLEDIKFECGTKEILVLENNIFEGGGVYRLKEVPKICKGKAFIDVKIIFKHWWEIKDV